MYEHSVKVPRLYKTAAKIAQKVKEDGASLKQLVYEQKHLNIKGLYALILHTLQNEDNLSAIIRHSQILTKENRLDPWLARVLITELLWGKKKLPGTSKPVTTVLSYQDKFLEDTACHNKTKLMTKKVSKPKYVRINTLKMTVEEAVNNFRNEGWSLVRCGNGSDYAAFLATAASLSEDQFMVDILVKDLLLFPSGAEFYGHKLYKTGHFVIQDKASCLAPFLLNPPSGATVLDMCSAPGMKCMQLAGMVGNTGQIYAVERDQRRFETLKNLLQQAGATNVKTLNKDTLALTESDMPNVEYILVDPSCSGSGMLDRVEFEDKSVKCNESRLQKLAGFQITLLRHALNNFKSAKKVVYSTCSIFAQENEEVVKKALVTSPDFKLLPINKFLKDKWYNFGSEDYGEIGQRCLYARPDFDHTNGFFIAVFERVKDGETNEFFIKRVQRSSECERVINEENEENTDSMLDKELKIKEKRRKRKDFVENMVHEDNEENADDTLDHETNIKKKRQKRKDFEDNMVNEENADDMLDYEKKMRHERKDFEENTEDTIDHSDAVGTSIKKKRQKRKDFEKDPVNIAKFEDNQNESIDELNQNYSKVHECLIKKTKKKKQNEKLAAKDESLAENSENKKKKRKKKSYKQLNETNESIEGENERINQDKTKEFEENANDNRKDDLKKNKVQRTDEIINTITENIVRNQLCKNTTCADDFGVENEETGDDTIKILSEEARFKKRKYKTDEGNESIDNAQELNNVYDGSIQKKKKKKDRNQESDFLHDTMDNTNFESNNSKKKSKKNDHAEETEKEKTFEDTLKTTQKKCKDANDIKSPRKKHGTREVFNKFDNAEQEINVDNVIKDEFGRSENKEEEINATCVDSLHKKKKRKDRKNEEIKQMEEIDDTEKHTEYKTKKKNKREENKSIEESFDDAYKRNVDTNEDEKRIESRKRRKHNTNDEFNEEEAKKHEISVVHEDNTFKKKKKKKDANRDEETNPKETNEDIQCNIYEDIDTNCKTKKKKKKNL